MARILVRVALLAVAGLVSAVPLLAWIGLGVHRHAPTAALAAAAVFLVYAPPLAIGFVADRRRRLEFVAAALGAWSLALFVMLPLYFPGERRDAVATGLGVLGVRSGAMALAERLPEEPSVSTPEVAEALPAAVEDRPLTVQAPLRDDQIALPYEGEGRRMSVPVIFGNHGRELEIEMMFDTGATYTTLSRAGLEKLGVHLGPNDPVITLHTANGERQSSVVLLDSVWLGDLRLDGVAIASCDDCASDDVGGLLGLNVSGRFNVSIDADQREVVFTRRENTDRKLDIKPFVDLSATFTRFPGGRAEVETSLANEARRAVGSATASVRCGAEAWEIALGRVEPASSAQTKRKLPAHDACAEYELSLQSATW